MKQVLLVTRDGLDQDEPIIQSVKSRFEVVLDPDDAEVVCVIGGDGTMLDAIREHQDLGVPFLGINRGHIGFLMNNPEKSVLEEIASGEIRYVDLRLLGIELSREDGEFAGWVTAFNDFYIERASTQTAHLRVTVNGQVRFDPLICDGIIVSSPAGSTAYNAAAGGATLPPDSRALVLTGICPAVFHNWRSGILQENSIITIEALDVERRPVRFMTDGVEVGYGQLIPTLTKAHVTFTNKTVQIGFVNSQDFSKKVADLQFGQHR